MATGGCQKDMPERFTVRTVTHGASQIGAVQGDVIGV